jgi:hypothetical protein
VGVVVEAEGERVYVRMNCKDRKGLLADIAVALQELQLQVGVLVDVRVDHFYRLWHLGKT